MQGVERVDRELLDAGALVGHLVAGGGMVAFLAAHRQDLFADAEFEDLFPSGRGRPSIPASVMASILVLQTLHDLSDRETAEAARCDLRWKVATGMSLDHQGFDPSTLVYWRKRLAKSGRPHRINDAVRKVVEETGILRGRRKRAVDSTILADAPCSTGSCTAPSYSPSTATPTAYATTTPATTHSAPPPPAPAANRYANHRHQVGNFGEQLWTRSLSGVIGRAERH